MANARACWCGNSDFKSFSPEYGECEVCGTLVALNALTDEQLVVQNDETDFYGKQYWTGHQAQNFGFPDISVRARNDLTERNLHWLKTLTKYKLAPANVVEIGCAHGSFVALLQQVGYQASGVEMSPWVVEFGKQTFAIPIEVGPVENLEIQAKSLDVIALMDVMEHLPDPIATMRHCLDLLRPDGILLIQTPQFREGMKYDDLLASQSIFLEQLKADEHLYLFSERSVTEFFRRLGADHINFEPAIFKHYDMFFVVGRGPITANDPAQVESSLLSTPNRRLALALLDLRERELNLADALATSEADRRARLEQINSLGAALKEVEVDRAARAVQIETLTSMLKASEADRTARGEQITSLTAMIKERELNLAEPLATSEADHVAWLEQINSLGAALKASEADRTARGEQITALTAMIKERELNLADALATSETDRLARLEQINSLGAALKEVEADRAARAVQIETLTSMLKASEADRSARGEQITTLTAMIKEAEEARASKNG